LYRAAAWAAETPGDEPTGQGQAYPANGSRIEACAKARRRAGPGGEDRAGERANYDQCGHHHLHGPLPGDLDRHSHGHHKIVKSPRNRDVRALASAPGTATPHDHGLGLGSGDVVTLPRRRGGQRSHPAIPPGTGSRHRWSHRPVLASVSGRDCAPSLARLHPRAQRVPRIRSGAPGRTIPRLACAPRWRRR
jgi:hypothetical protein